MRRESEATARLRSPSNGQEPTLRILVTLIFLAALAVFLRMGIRAISAHFGRPLARHRVDHERIEARLEALERDSEAARQP
jgi:hypothetical protein